MDYYLNLYHLIFEPINNQWNYFWVFLDQRNIFWRYELRKLGTYSQPWRKTRRQSTQGNCTLTTFNSNPVFNSPRSHRRVFSSLASGSLSFRATLQARYHFEPRFRLTIRIGNKTNQIKPFPPVSRQVGTNRKSYHCQKTKLWRDTSPTQSSH